MSFSKEAIREFKEIYKKKFGKEISDQEETISCDCLRQFTDPSQKKRKRNLRKSAGSRRPNRKE